MRSAHIPAWAFVLAVGQTTAAWAQHGDPTPPAAPHGDSTAAIATAPPLPTAAEDAALPTLLSAMSPEARLYFQHVTTLANPFFEGRAPGSRGNVLAAEYVEFFFKQSGLKPIFPSTAVAADGTTEVVTPRSSFRQTFTYPAGIELIAKTQELKLVPPGTGDAALATTFEPTKDFVPMGVSGQASATGPLVFVGYSIQDGPDGYSTFAEGDDLKGKIAMVLRFEPKNAEGKSRWAEAGAGSGWSNRAGLLPKLRAAVDRGAAGVILVSPPGADDPRINQLDDLRTSRRIGAPLEIPVVQMSIPAAERLLRAAGQNLRRLTEAADQTGGITATNTTVSLAVEIERKQIETDNIASYLPGRGELADQFIVLGAHMDHLGYGYFGSRDRSPAGKLHPGADDNASGTAGLLLAAQRLKAAYAELPENTPARSIIFIAFCAEESGLNGARHFVRNAPVEAKQIYAMLNMDMIGRLRNNKLEVSGVGTAKGFADWLSTYFTQSGMDVRTLPGGQGPSDHAAFYGAGIPVLHFFTGLTREYHMPTDTFDTINPVGGSKIAELVSKVALGLATRAETLEFERPTGPSINMVPPDQQAAAAPPGQAQASGPGMGGVRVRFGISPGNYSDDKPGIEVGEVFPGTTAADAGLKAGDRLIKWDGQPIADVETWMPMLGKHKPGDIVEIVWMRGDREMTAKATLKGRDRDDR